MPVVNRRGTSVRAISSVSSLAESRGRSQRQWQEPGRTYRIGFLLPTNRRSPPVQALFDELRLNGFIEGQNW